MTLWVDADACPGPIRDIILKAAERLQLKTIFVANKRLALRPSRFVSSVQVAHGLDVADAHIAAASAKGDVAVTQDIPLAALLVPKGVVVMDPRGALFTEENIAERLSVRNFMQEMRESGVDTGGPSGFSDRDKQRFAGTLDRELTRLNKAGAE
jgi:uncharacterized protein YaiI (UPF0178 family)